MYHGNKMSSHNPGRVVSLTLFTFVMIYPKAK